MPTRSMASSPCAPAAGPNCRRWRSAARCASCPIMPAPPALSTNATMWSPAVPAPAMRLGHASEDGDVTDDLVTAISTPDAPKPAGHYAQAVVHGGLVYVSGQLPVRPDGTHLTQAAFPEQAAQALANLLAILHAAGCGPERVLKVTVYI